MPARTGKGARGRADAVRRGEFRPGGTPKRTDTSWLDFHEGDALDEARHAQWMPHETPLPGRSVRGHRDARSTTWSRGLAGVARFASRSSDLPRRRSARTRRWDAGRRSGPGPPGTRQRHPAPATSPPPIPVGRACFAPAPTVLLPTDTTLPATTSPRSRNHCYDHSASGGKDGNTHERTRLIDGTHSPPRQARPRHPPPRPGDCGFQIHRARAMSALRRRASNPKTAS